MTEIVGERKSPPLTIEFVNELLYRHDLALSRHQQAVARGLGLNDAEMSAVTLLRYCGELKASQIASALGMSSAGTTALVQRLQEAAVTRRRRHPTDGRSTLIRLASQTARRLTLADAQLDDALGEVIAALSDEERAAVSRFLSRLTDLTERHGVSSDNAVEAPYQPVPSLWG